jgi:retron-type reverse transcriptase
MYLKSVLVAFGFPPILIDSLIHLFFDNQVRININGHFTVHQRCGLRQGDPLSPLLSNLALEPLLRHIIQEQAIRGFHFNDDTRYANPSSFESHCVC